MAFGLFELRRTTRYFLIYDFSALRVLKEEKKYVNDNKRYFEYMDGWIICDFTSFSTAFHSFHTICG